MYPPVPIVPTPQGSRMVGCCDERGSGVNVNVNVEFNVTLHEQVRYGGTLQY